MNNIISSICLTMNDFHLFSPVKQVVLTSPNNPSGYVYTRSDVQRIVHLCKEHNAWLVVDQTYCEFLYDDAQHVFPCGKHLDFAYDKIVHVFSFSKIFGIPGWRVGYLACSTNLVDAMEKVILYVSALFFGVRCIFFVYGSRSTLSAESCF